MTIETRKLWRADGAALLRLARWLDIPTPARDCLCQPCRSRLVELVKRRVP